MHSDRQHALGLGVADALCFAGIELRHTWHNAVRRGVYPEAPPTTKGRAARFGADDLTAAYVLGWLLQRAILPKFAGQIATDVRRLLRKLPDVTTLSAWKVAGKRGPRVVVSERAPTADAIALFEFQIGEIRQRAAAGIAAKHEAINR